MYVCMWYLVARENDVLDVGDVGLGHASEDGRQAEEAVERKHEDEQTLQRRHLVRQRRQVIVVQV